MYDLIIIGLGGMGSAALFQAARRGAKVLGIDRYDPPHLFGSSHAETRITRLSIGEGPQYMPFVARSHEIWRELAAETGEQLLYQPGGYIICPKENSAQFHGEKIGDDFVVATVKLASANKIDYEHIDGNELRRRHSRVLAKESDHAVFEPTGGFVLSERAVDTQLTLARQLGAVVHTHEPVISVQPDGDGVTVITEQGKYTAAKAIVSAGAWVHDFLPQQQQSHFTIFKQIVYWFEVDQPADFDINRWPFLLWVGETLADYYCSFAMVPGGLPGLKMVTEQYVDACDPSTVSRDVTQAEIDHFYQTLAINRLTGVRPTAIKAQGCLYTNTPDEHFVIDHHPNSDRILIASPCSGHGFKHSAAIGESIVQWALEGGSRIDLSPFRFPL